MTNTIMNAVSTATTTITSAPANVGFGTKVKAFAASPYVKITGAAVVGTVTGMAIGEGVKACVSKLKKKKIDSEKKSA